MTSTEPQPSNAAPDTPDATDPDRVIARMARRDDNEAITALLLASFDPWPPYEITCSAAEHVEWKMNANESSWAHQNVATLVDDDRAVIAAAFHVRRTVWVRGELAVAVDIADQCVHPDWRFMRIREKRHELREAMGQNDHDMLLSWLPHHPATRKESIENPTLGNRVLVWWKPASLRSLVSIPLRTAGRKHAARVALEAARYRLRGQFGRRRPSFEGELVTLDRFDDRTDALWHEAKHQFDFAVERTQDYLNWRYADARSGRFVIRAAVRGDRVVGYAVTKPYADPAQIVDLLVRPDRLDLVDALVTDTLALVGREGSRDVQCWLPQHHPYVATLREHGFLDAGRDPSVRYTAGVFTEEQLAFLVEPDAAVHITCGDSDFV